MIMCVSEMFKPDAKGRVNSLTTVLQQEVDRFNKLLKVIKVCLTSVTWCALLYDVFYAHLFDQANHGFTYHAGCRLCHPLLGIFGQDWCIVHWTRRSILVV